VGADTWVHRSARREFAAACLGVLEELDEKASVHKLKLRCHKTGCSTQAQEI
jgi:hypothetical protein